jgi:hypothetical protein
MGPICVSGCDCLDFMAESRQLEELDILHPLAGFSETP